MDDFQQEPIEQTASATVESADVEQETVNTEAEEQKVQFDERQQEKVNELIGSKVAKQREAERRAEELEAQLQELKSRQPVETAPAVPEVPNPDDYYGDDAGLQNAMKEYGEAIAKRAEYDARIAANEERQRQQALEQQRKDAQAQYERQAKYVETAKTFNITPEQINSDAASVSPYLGKDMQDHIVSDPQGPLIVNYLAKNPIALDELRSMSPFAVGAYIEAKIRPAIASTRKTTQAPKPVEIVGGASVPATEHPSLKDAVFK
jgi:dsDNA-specific endonuclease/ATPase MutS2